MTDTDVFLFRTRFKFLGANWSAFDLLLLVAIYKAAFVLPLFIVVLFGIICGYMTQLLAEIIDKEIENG